MSNIPIVVKYGTEVIELQAIRGSVPQKFLAPVGTPWIPERVEIQNGFPQFSSWVQTIATPWGDLTPDNLYNLKFVSNFNINNWGGSIEKFWATMDDYPAMYVDNENQITITLGNGQSLQEGDQIAITGYRKNDDNAAGTLYIKCNGNVVAQTQDYNNISYDAYPNTFVFSVPSDMAGYSSFQLSRDLNGAQIYITGITVIGGLGAQRDDSTTNTTPTTPTTPTTTTTPTAPTVTRPDNPTYDGDVTFSANWTNYVSLDKETYPAVGNVGNGTIVRVYGYGTSNDWHVKLARQETEWIDIEEKKGSNSYTFTEPLTFTLNDEQATKLKNSGILIIYGKDYVVRYVYIDNSGVSNDTVEEDDEEENNDDDDEILLWEDTATSGAIDISGADLANAGLKDGSTIRVYGTRGQWYGDVQLQLLPNNAPISYVQTKVWDSDDGNYDSDGYVDNVIGAGAASEANEKGIHFTFGNFTCKRIVVIP